MATAKSLSNTSEWKCSIGVISDIQYADVEDGYNYSKTSKRYYREALMHLIKAVDTWLKETNDDAGQSQTDKGTENGEEKNTEHGESERPVTMVTEKRKKTIQCILQLGDVLDGRSKRNGTNHHDLQAVLVEFHRLPIPTYHLLGNHEFYNFSRKELLDSELNTARILSGAVKIPHRSNDYHRVKPNTNSTSHKNTSPTPHTSTNSTKSSTRKAKDFNIAYYHTSPVPGVRIVCLDPYDISMLGYEPSASQYKEAEAMIRNVNKNSDLNDYSGLPSPNERYTKFNGALGPQQMQWFEEVLSAADSDREIVIVAGHIPINDDDPVCKLWNAEAVLALLAKHPCVQLFIAGHTHVGSYAKDKSGVHHLTLPGIIEVPPGNVGFGTLDVYADRIEVRGYSEGGNAHLKSRTMFFRK